MVWNYRKRSKTIQKGLISFTYTILFLINNFFGQDIQIFFYKIFLLVLLIEYTFVLYDIPNK